MKRKTDFEEKDSRFGYLIFDVFMRFEEFRADVSGKAHAHSAHTRKAKEEKKKKKERKAKERATSWTV